MLDRSRRYFNTIGLSLIAALGLAACGAASAGTGAGGGAATGGGSSAAASAGSGSPSGAIPQVRPQVIEPTPGVQAPALSGGAPIGDPNAHAPSLAEVKNELRLELIAVSPTSARYIDPLRYVTIWGRTDQGVDAALPVGAPILAPCRVKVLAVIPDWYAGQPLVYFELLEGPDAGKVQYVAEQITDIAPVGILQQGQVIARFAPSGTDIEYGWATMTGETLARETTGYFEGEVTPAGRSMRAWLNSLGANAGTG
jgi:hypothetical protein